MAVSVAQICNLALAHIKQTRTTISNLTTDRGNTAVQCRIHYDVAREFVQADYDWNFNRLRVDLTDKQSPPTDWLYRYDYPSNALKVREIIRLTQRDVPVPYMVERDPEGAGLTIVTNMRRATAMFSENVENPALFSPGFVTAFGWYLASELTPALSGSEDLQKACLSVYQRSLLAAQSVDSGENEFIPERDASWDEARHGFVGGGILRDVEPTEITS